MSFEADSPDTKFSSEQDSPSRRGKRWTKQEDELLKEAIEQHGASSWKEIAKFVETRTDLQCFHRWQKVLKPGLTKGPWKKDEDNRILELIDQGVSKWSNIAKLIPGRLGKQIRERYYNHLDPSIRKDPWTIDEDEKLLNAQREMGNKWAAIAKLIPGRPENMVKNRWNVLNYPRKRSKPNKTRSFESATKSRKRKRVAKSSESTVGSPATSPTNEAFDGEVTEEDDDLFSFIDAKSPLRGGSEALLDAAKILVSMSTDN